MDVLEGHAVEEPCQGTANTAISSNGGEMDFGAALQARLVEVLMPDGISPLDHLIKELSATPVSCVHGVDIAPEIYPKPPEIASDVSRIGVTLVELSAGGPVLLEDRLKGSWNDLDEFRDRFGVQVSTEPLEAGRKQDHVCLVDLLSRVPSTARDAADRCMRSLKFVESVRALVPPTE